MTDEQWLAHALELAARGRGATSPNPRVGAVVVRNDVILGAGYPARAGQRHAEVVALDAAGGAARGATLYCTLEPCSHTGRTPPCARRIVAEGVARVVVASEDPDPRVDGAGCEILRMSGIPVVTGVLREPARRLNEGFLSDKERGRPFVTLKAAVSRDGRIASAPGTRTLLTGEAAQWHAHRVRTEIDAIAVGSETVLVDDPVLTARGDRERRRPLVRVVFDTRLRTPPTARLLRTLEEGPVVVMTTRSACDQAPERASALARAGAMLELLSERDPREAVHRLVDHDVCSVLLEGGALMYRACWTAGVVDRLRLYVAPTVLGGAGVGWWPDHWETLSSLEWRGTGLGTDVLMESDVQRVD